ncbi:MAG: hypothetical protein ACRC1H_13630, partial [Caldilineaceae bacterium]
MIKEPPVGRKEAAAVRPAPPPSHWLLGHLRAFSADPLGMMQLAAATARVPRLRFINNTAWLAIHP